MGAEVCEGSEMRLRKKKRRPKGDAEAKAQTEARRLKQTAAVRHSILMSANVGESVSRSDVASWMKKGRRCGRKRRGDCRIGERQSGARSRGPWSGVIDRNSLVGKGDIATIVKLLPALRIGAVRRQSTRTGDTRPQR